jgi:hypothetical protein
MSVATFPILPNLEVIEKTLDCFLERDTMRGKFVPIEVILEVGWYKSGPIHYWLAGSLCFP